jgi:hypothetical protein
VTQEPIPTPLPTAEERDDKVYRMLRRYERAKFLLHLITVAGVFIILGFVVVSLNRAEEGRAEIRDCIRPQGQCAQRGAQGTKDIGAVIVVCTNKLPPLVSKQEALNCIVEELTK